MSDKNVTSEVTLYDKIQDPIQAIEKLGEWISKSGLFGCEKVEQGMVLAMTSLAERRPVTEICRRYHIVKNKLSMRSDAMLAEFNQRGGTHFWEKSDEKEAILLLTKGQFKDYRVTYTIKDAERAELCGKDGSRLPGQNFSGSWQKNPSAQLRARATSKGIRMVDPGVVAGMVTPEEADDRPSIDVVATVLPPLLSVPNKTIATTVVDEPKKDTVNGKTETSSNVPAK
jgi:hypothetical protein